MPSGNMREVSLGGNTICGKWLPERVRCTPFLHFGIFTDELAQTRLSVAQYTVYNSPLYWHHPEKFVPERWMLDEPGYEDYHNFDRRDALLPFSTGPRNCIGKKYVLMFSAVTCSALITVEPLAWRTTKCVSSSRDSCIISTWNYARETRTGFSRNAG